ncbi:nitrogen regulation protein NR(I) [Ahniella affigens]|uniref:DNA-binding transcriptional regulator NtrC n=1 Tax=Ahniella affigens TaxID=2021234 RepID=A0A2P1PP07_9GAMM|nr:nitrogen regulation protein NR(I) [Ahniella affigens]AVP96566.1 nitrogen regulation protein NR(I) [Ahniella affigens]
MPEIWLIDDDRSVRFVLAEALRDAGYMVRDFDNAKAALSVLPHARPGAVFTDVRMPGMDGIAFLEVLKREHADVPVVVMSAYTDVASTSAAFKGGAFDFLPKPFDLDAAVRLADRALADQPGGKPRLPNKAAPLQAELLGESAPMRELYRAIGRVAPTHLSVLITGETGTGKELVARALHQHSLRANQPFVALNTAAIPADLLESELFGHEAGAFTGATKRHPGRFEQAEGGTLFLDEIGDMPLALQTRLLRVLAEGEFYRVGGRELIRVDVRVIAATHQDLEGKAARGEFRADLLHRLDVMRLSLPPLRARREDVDLLAQRFMQRAAVEMQAETKVLKPEALKFLRQQVWPGNVRQLENFCRRLAVMAPGREIGLADLPVNTLAGFGLTAPTPEDEFAAPVDASGPDPRQGLLYQASGQASSTEHRRVARGGEPPGDWKQALREEVRRALKAQESGIYDAALAAFERVVLDAALDVTQKNRFEAARLLGIGRNTITRKLGSSRTRRKPGA